MLIALLAVTARLAKNVRKVGIVHQVMKMRLFVKLAYQVVISQVQEKRLVYLVHPVLLILLLLHIVVHIVRTDNILLAQVAQLVPFANWEEEL